MIRLESFDCLNPHKRKILRLLSEREFNLREIVEGAGKSRSANWNALKLLERAGLIVPKKAKKVHWSVKAKQESRDIVRYILTEDGKHAVAYFSEFEKGVGFHG